MIVKFGAGYDNFAGLAEIPYRPSNVGIVDFERVYGADGVAYPVGGGESSIEYGYLEREELQDLLVFFGLSDESPSRKAIVLMEDSFSIPRTYNCIISYIVPARGAGVLDNVRFELSRMEAIYT